MSEPLTIDGWVCPQCGPLPYAAKVDDDGWCLECRSTCLEPGAVRALLHGQGLRMVDALEGAVLDAVAAIPEQELRSQGNWYGWAKPIGEAVRALRAARKGAA